MNTLTALTLTVSAVTGPGWVLSAHRAHGLSRRLHTDRLTGMANRDQLTRTFRKACRRPGGTIGVLLLDLDRFKQINDAHGHDVGNQVLRHVAGQLRRACRDDELAVRLHGDEFAVLLGDLPGGAQAQQVAERRATEFAAAVNKPMRSGEHVLTVTPSIGTAVAAVWHADLSALLRAADQRMYAAKPGRPEPARDAAAGRWSR